MGLAGLTAVFGMGTGGAPPVWSPGIRPPGGQAGTAAVKPAVRSHKPINQQANGRGVGIPAYPPRGSPHIEQGNRHGAWGTGNVTPTGRTAPRVWRATGRGGQAIGCWNWSAAAVARRALPAHRPGRLPGAFRACALGNLVLKRASRLDAFSAYPFPTWLPGDAPSGTAGTPEVGPPQSSRTRGDPSQVSYAHGR